eukprot:Amastigsp_a512579_10.p4 type:complete len:130 gc:universal Amastigsp_a512579_10:596-985(+)
MARTRARAAASSPGRTNSVGSSAISSNASCRTRTQSPGGGGSLPIERASTAKVGRRYSYWRLSQRFFALKALMTRVNPKTRICAGSAALMRATTSASEPSTWILSAITWPAACTPRSVRAARENAYLPK